MIRARGLPEPACKDYCVDVGVNRGCSREIDGHTYRFCSRCADLGDHCPHGVQQGSAACERGCEIEHGELDPGAQDTSAGCFSATTGDTGSYDTIFDQELGPKKAVHFTVRAPNDAHIGFFSDRKATDELYEVVLSGWGNTQSVIRESSQGANQVVHRTPGLLSRSVEKQFWASAEGGLVLVGEGDELGKRVLMKWQDPNPHEAVFVGVMTGWGATGVWSVCFDGSADAAAPGQCKNAYDEGSLPPPWADFVSCSHELRWSPGVCGENAQMARGCKRTCGLCGDDDGDGDVRVRPAKDASEVVTVETTFDVAIPKAGLVAGVLQQLSQAERDEGATVVYSQKAYTAVSGLPVAVEGDPLALWAVKSGAATPLGLLPRDVKVAIAQRRQLVAGRRLQDTSAQLEITASDNLGPALEDAGYLSRFMAAAMDALRCARCQTAAGLPARPGAAAALQQSMQASELDMDPPEYETTVTVRIPMDADDPAFADGASALHAELSSPAMYDAISRKVPLTERKVVLVQGAQKGVDKTVSHMLAVISITTFVTSFAITTFATSFATTLSSSPTLFR